MANRKSLSIFSNSSILLAKISIATLAIAVPLMARQVPPQLQITSPANGTIINPGQTISVTVTSPANVTFRQVAVIGGDPVGLSSTATSVPAQLTLTIPSDISCGELMLTAQGVTTSGQSVESATILVDVERPDLPISLSTPLGGLTFRNQGEEFPLVVLATFSDGSILDVSASSYVTYTSSNTNVATIDANGKATAAGPGSGFITATYALSNNKVQISIPVNMPQPSGGGGTTNFFISATPGAQTVAPGSATTFTISTNSYSGFTGAISFAVNGLPSGVTANFSPTSVNVSGSSTLTISTLTSSPVGSYVLTVTGTGGTLSTNLSVSLTINTLPPGFSLLLTPGSETVSAGVNASFGVSVSPQGGFNGSVTLSASGLPANATASFSPSSISGGSGSSTLTVATGPGTPLGTYTLTITGTSGSIVHSSNVTVTLILGFVPSGGLLTARWNHTSTMLNNGIVLIAGGDDVNDHPTASAELYNPATGTFTSTGSLITALDVHTATLLNNGFVLIANGGISSELYNPATGSFMATGIMATPRGGHSATLLSNGMVLIVGGDLYRSAELYNPATGVFTATGNTNVEHSYHTATLLNNGLVLISGGTTGNTIAELYTPSTGVFSLTGSLNSGRQFSSATLLNDGKVLIAGGSKNIGLVTFYASTEVYDPTTGVFTPGGNMTSARESHSATLLNNGTVLLAGGDNGTTALASAEIYDPATSTSTLVANMSTPRDYHTATLLGNGQILVAAGLRSTTTTSAGSSAELFTPGGLIPSGLTSISLAPVNPSVPAGGGLSFSATGTLSNNSTQTLASAQWSSSNSSVVTITNDSKNHANALAVAPGSATIRACAGSICGATTITVTSQPPAPSITSLSPSLGTDNISVTITGQNFGSSQGTSVVSFNGAPATVTSWNPTSIIVTVPVGATSGNVVVTAYGVTSNGVYFTDAPVISTLSLTSAPTMGLLTITGTGFASSQGTSTVTFNGTPATSFLDWNKSSIILRIPSGATAGNLIVTVNGVASNGVFFTPTPPPSITSLSPTSGMVGDSVTITGANFGSSQGSNAVRLYYTLGRVTVSNPASVTSWNATTIVVTVPIRTSGSGNPTVKVLVDGIASNGVNFTLLLPTIASLSPTSGPVGTSVTITGSNFRSTQGSSTVTFNGTLASPTNWSATSIVVPVPLGATTGAVVVTVNGQAGNGVTFTVQ